MFSYLIGIDRPHSYKTAWAQGSPMPDAYLSNRPVYFDEVEFNGCDSYFVEATYADTGKSLNNEELEKLGTEFANYLVEGSIEKHGYFRK